ncbi:MAG: hypothetical protein K0U72_06570 [Gammaproteobacteria bacterium]|nr:hypothetical protein [Gammaproteobacteria bacterium]
MGRSVLLMDGHRSAFNVASLVENLPNCARARAIDGSERRVNTALRNGSDSASEHLIARSVRLRLGRFRSAGT